MTMIKKETLRAIVTAFQQMDECQQQYFLGYAECLVHERRKQAGRPLRKDNLKERKKAEAVEQYDHRGKERVGTGLRTEQKEDVCTGRND